MTRNTVGLIVVAGVMAAWLAGRLLIERSVARPADLAPTHFGRYSPEMDLRAGFESLPAGETAALTLLSNNTDAWIARWRLLARTRHTLDISYFILRQDIFGAAFLGHLLKKSGDGVAIRLLLDAQGTTMSSNIRGNDYLDTIANARNIELKLYRPLLNRYVEALVKLNPAAAMASEHDKIIVADGARGMIGGRNISAEYFAHPEDDPHAFRDMDVVLEGHGMAQGLTRAFEVEYASDHARSIRPEAVDIADAAPDLLLAYYLMDAWLHDKPPAPAVLDEIAKRKLPWRDEIEKYPLLRGRIAKPEARALRAETRLLDSHARLHASADAIAEGLARLTRSARTRILIVSPYLVLSETAVKVLEDAGRRGVDIDVLTNSPISSDNALSQAFFLEQWPELLARVPRLQIFVVGEKRTLHSKLMIFDGQAAVIGTYNLDPVSMGVNSELMAAVWSEAFARQAALQPSRLIAAGAPKVYEYRIQRDANGEAVRDTNGKPIVAFGPNDHSPPEEWKQVQVYWKMLRAAEHLPGFSPIF